MAVIKTLTFSQDQQILARLVNFILSNIQAPVTQCEW